MNITENLKSITFLKVIIDLLNKLQKKVLDNQLFSIVAFFAIIGFMFLAIPIFRNLGRFIFNFLRSTWIYIRAILPGSAIKAPAIGGGRRRR